MTQTWWEATVQDGEVVDTKQVLRSPDHMPATLFQTYPTSHQAYGETEEEAIDAAMHEWKLAQD
ncbi:MAG TPA: hypothetical protein VML95_03460 [Longimicrobiales bacterium]|nr:hypothetical protein [Longimicrobiales bacterium]